MKILALFTSLVMSVGLYPQTCKAVNIDRTNDIVTMSTATGMEYQFYGCSDYEVDDIISVIMWDNGTDKVTDDVVIICKYAGRF